MVEKAANTTGSPQEMPVVSTETIIRDWLSLGFGTKLIKDQDHNLSGGMFPTNEKGLQRCMIFFDGTVVVIEPDEKRLDSYFALVDSRVGYVAIDGLNTARGLKSGNYSYIKVVAASPFARTQEEEDLIVQSVSAAKKMVEEGKWVETDADRRDRIAQRVFDTLISNNPES